MNAGDDSLGRLLRRVSRRERWRAVALVAARSCLVMTLLLAGVVGLDGAVGLSGYWRVVVDVGLGGVGIAVGALLGRQWWRYRFEARRVARVVEERQGITDSALITAVELGGARSAAGAISPGLLELALARGRAVGQEVTPARVIQWGDARRAWGIAAGFMAGLIVVGRLGFPGLISTVGARLGDPLGDTPPYQRDGGNGSANWPISGDGVAGLAAMKPAGREVQAVSDTPPTVEIIDPSGEVGVPLGWAVSVQAQASDDVAVTRMGWRVTKGGKSVTGEMTASGIGQPQAQGWAEIDPGKVGARVGDRVTIQAIAVNNAPGHAGTGAGGRQGESEPLVVRIISDEEYRALLASQYGPEQAREDAERWSDELGEQERRHEALATAAAAAMTQREDEGGQMEEVEWGLAQQGERGGALATGMRRRARGPHLNEADAEFARELAAAAEGLEAEGSAAMELRGAMMGMGNGTIGAAHAAAEAALERYRRSGVRLAAAKGKVGASGAALAGAMQAHAMAKAASGGGTGAAQVQGPHLDPSAGRSAAGELSNGLLEAMRPGVGTRAEVYNPAIKAGPLRAEDVQGFINGVPEQYRDLARAYFRRLEEDGKSEH